MNSVNVEIRHETRTDGGRFSLSMEGGEAELTYRLRDGVMAIDHTFTPPALRGGGLASRLMKAAVAHARAEGWTIRPVCPYAAAWMQRHPEEQDLLESAP